MELVAWPSVINALGWATALVVGATSLWELRRHKARMGERLASHEEHIRQCDHIIRHWRDAIDDLRRDVQRTARVARRRLKDNEDEST